MKYFYIYLEREKKHREKTQRVFIKKYTRTYEVMKKHTQSFLKNI